MHPLIETHREQIESLCLRYGVRRLDVFGSAIRDDFDVAKSDVDMVVDFNRPASGGSLEQYFGLKEDMEHLLGRPVDLIELKAMADTRLKRLIVKNKAPLYAAQA